MPFDDLIGKNDRKIYKHKIGVSRTHSEYGSIEWFKNLPKTL